MLTARQTRGFAEVTLRRGRGEDAMTVKLYLTITAIVAVLYGLGFVLIPASLVPLYGAPTEPHVILNAQFFGSALLALAVITWFAKDFRDWDAVRGVLVGIVVTDVVGGLLSIWATTTGVLNAFGWSSVIVYVLLLVGALYSLWTRPQKA
jgi:uncharacterized membrane protein YfcA